jgi:hypothetical protein
MRTVWTVQASRLSEVGGEVVVSFSDEMIDCNARIDNAGVSR